MATLCVCKRPLERDRVLQDLVEGGSIISVCMCGVDQNEFSDLFSGDSSKFIAVLVSFRSSGLMLQTSVAFEFSVCGFPLHHLCLLITI